MTSLAGCAADGGLDLMTTGSINQAAPVQSAAAKPRIDPACIELTARIDALRKEGTAERLAKVANGKTKTASVKRDALARMAKLDAANQEFQSKCSTLATAPSVAPAASAAAPTATVANAAQAAANTAATAATTANAAKSAATTAQQAATTAKSAAAIAKATATN